MYSEGRYLYKASTPSPWTPESSKFMKGANKTYNQYQQVKCYFSHSVAMSRGGLRSLTFSLFWKRLLPSDVTCQADAFWERPLPPLAHYKITPGFCISGYISHCYTMVVNTSLFCFHIKGSESWDLMLSEISEREKDKNHMISLLWGIYI